MSENNVISFKDVTKVYKLYKNDKQRFKGIFSRRVKYKGKKAIDNLSFDIKKGTTDRKSVV